jgi:hypothetical protein
MAHVTANWIERFATRFIQLQPETHPLDAVRSATDAYSAGAELTPEDAADMSVAGDSSARNDLERFSHGLH